MISVYINKQSSAAFSFLKNFNKCPLVSRFSFSHTLGIKAKSSTEWVKKVIGSCQLELIGWPWLIASPVRNLVSRAECVPATQDKRDSRVQLWISGIFWTPGKSLEVSPWEDGEQRLWPDWTHSLSWDYLRRCMSQTNPWFWILIWSVIQ